MDYLDSPEGKEDAAGYALERSTLGWNFLHTLCWSGAPCDLIERVVGICPSLTSDVDVLGRTPLHTSVCYALDVDVVSQLLTADRSAASIKDARGRTPLLYACEKAGQATVSTEQTHLRLIQTLIKASPGTIFDEDEDEMSAIELAVCSNAPTAIVETLQKVAVHMGKRAQTMRRLARAKFVPSRRRSTGGASAA